MSSISLRLSPSLTHAHTHAAPGIVVITKTLPHTTDAFLHLFPRVLTTVLTLLMSQFISISSPVWLSNESSFYFAKRGILLSSNESLLHSTFGLLLWHYLGMNCCVRDKLGGFYAKLTNIFLSKFFCTSSQLAYHMIQCIFSSNFYWIRVSAKSYIFGWKLFSLWNRVFVVSPKTHGKNS